MEHSSKNLRRPDVIHDEELWQEIQEAFSEPLLLSRPSLAADFKILRPPAAAKGIARLLTGWADALPAAYLDFLRESDGAAGCASDYEGDYLTLWGSGELVELNTCLPTRQFLPSLLAIGTDGRGAWIGFDRVASQDPEHWPVVRCDPGSSQPADVRELAPNFREWRKSGFRLQSGGCACGGG